MTLPANTSQRDLVRMSLICCPDGPSKPKPGALYSDTKR